MTTAPATCCGSPAKQGHRRGAEARMRVKSILSTAVSAGAKAITDYLDMTGDANACDLPEYWLTARISDAFFRHNEHYVFLEHPISEILKYAKNDDDSILSLQRARKTGKIDIALYGKKLLPTEASLEALIEIKIMNNDWCFNEDADRILDIAKVCGGQINGIVGGLFNCKSEIQAKLLIEESEKRLGELEGMSKIAIMASPIISRR